MVVGVGGVEVQAAGAKDASDSGRGVRDDGCCEGLVAPDGEVMGEVLGVAAGEGGGISVPFIEEDVHVPK